MAASSKQPFPVENFSGGITDNIFAGVITTAQEMDNFVIAPDTKLQSRSGSVVDDALNSPLPTGNTRVGRLINYARNEKLFLQSGRNFFYRTNADQTGAWVDLLGPSGNQVLAAGTTSNYVSTSEWAKQMFIVSDAFVNPMKIYKDQAGHYQVRNVGAPALASSPTIVAATSGSANSYIYAFIYTYQYQVNQQSFIEEGPTTQVTATDGGTSGTPSNTISAIPVVTNSGGDNYDTANIQVQIYRTINNGVNFYLCGQVTNGVTTFTDSMNDTTLQEQPQLYTNDGTLDYNPAPKAKYIHVVGNVGLYGYTSDADGPHPYRIHQSVEGNPGFVPAITYVDLEDEVKGIGSVKALPIALCKRFIYRLDGNFASSGSGGITPTKIHNSAGCISHESIIEAENYLFWAGLDGFYSTDGYTVIKVSDHLNPTYQAMLKATKDQLRIQGRFDESNRRVYWAVQTNAASLDNDSLFCLDLRWTVSPASTFTTWSGTSFKPTAIEVFNGLLYRGDVSGFVYCHDNQTLTDPRLDVSKAASLWAEETVRWTYLSNELNFGSAFFRKFVTRILLQAENAGNTSIQITAINDQGKSTRALKPIRWKRNVTWGDESLSWGNIDCIWNAQGLIEQWRRFPAKGLRLSYLQLLITNAFSIITTSENDGTCVLNKAAKTAVLPNLWPSQSADYTIYFANDGYTKGYQVGAVNSSSDTLTLLDPGGNLPGNGSYDWQLFGYEKGEPLNMIGYTLHWDNVDQNQATYHTGDSGAS